MGALPPNPRDTWKRESRFPFGRYPGEREGQRPSGAEEEAQPDDETKVVRASAQFSNRQPRCIAG